MADEQITALEQEVTSENAKRSGKGTRLVLANTRGKGSIQIKYEAFDSDSAGSLPTTVSEFMSLSGVSDEDTLVSYLVTGFNDASYKKASDPVAEFVNPMWPEAVQDSFKQSVKSLLKNTDKTLEELVAIFRPAIDAQFGAK